MTNKNSATFFILHGSWQASEGWAEVQQLLVQEGYAVELLDLPGHGNNNGMDYHKINLNTYVTFVCKKIQEMDRGRVVLVGHSMSGMVVSQVAENMPIHKLVYVSAFLSGGWRIFNGFS